MQMKFFELIKSGTNHDFIKWRKVAVVGSIVVNVLVLLGATVWPKLNYGVDFAGGTELQVRFNKAIDASDVRDEVSKAGFGEPTVQAFDKPETHQFLVRVERVALLTKDAADAARARIVAALPNAQMTSYRFDPEVGDKLDLAFKGAVDEGVLRDAVVKSGIDAKEVRTISSREGADREYTVIAQGPADKIGSRLRDRFGADSVEVVRTEYVGPQVGKQLKKDGVLAVLYAMLMILFYVGVRFDFAFSPGVVIALIHDAIITLGFFVVSRHEFNLTSVTAILTVVGYSVNDTIVVYDRIRENAKRFKGKPLREIVNLSINEMLGRTILTSGATALSLVGLLILGVGTIWDFSMAMLVGIISGTYSTWYIASPMTIYLEERADQRRALEAAQPRSPKPPPPGSPKPRAAAAR